MMPPMNDVTNDAGRNERSALRMIVIALLCVGGVVIGLLLSGRLGGERWRNVVPSTNAVTPVFFSHTEAGASLVRMTDGSVERASESARTKLPLVGKPRIFARGPANTIAFQSESDPFVFHSLGADSTPSDTPTATLTLKADIPTVKHVVTGEATRDRGTPLIIVSTSGVATLWSTHGVSVDRGPQLVKSLMNMKVARFSEGNAHLYVSYLDGGIDRFELASGTPTLALHARGMVKAIGAAAGSVVVADDKGVRWFDENVIKARANLTLPSVVAVEHGHLPKGSQSGQGWLALTSDGTQQVHALHVISSEQGGRALSRIEIPLPPGERAVAMTSTPRAILVATDRGGVWQLSIQ